MHGRRTYEEVALTLCALEDGAAYRKLQCLQRQCNKCGCDNIVKYFHPLADQVTMDTVVYSKWERVPISRKESMAQRIINIA